MSQNTAMRPRNPSHLSVNWINFSPQDVYFAGFTGTIAIIVALICRSSLLFIALLGVCAFFLHRWSYGRTYYLIGEAAMSFKITHFDKGVIWKQGKKYRKPPVPFEVNEVGDYGVVYTPSLFTDTLYIVGDGSDIPALNFEAQISRYDQIARAIRNIATVNGLSAGISFGLRRRPADIGTYDAYAQGDFGSQVILPHVIARGIPESEWTDEDYDWVTLYEMHKMRREEVVIGSSFDVTMFMAITIARSAKLKAAAEKNVDLYAREVYRLPIFEMAEVAVSNLKSSGVENPRVLNFRETEQFMRGWDIGTLQQYQHNERALQAAATPEERRQRKEEEPRHWPQLGIWTKKDLMVTDTTGHIVHNVVEAPESSLPDTMRALYYLNVPYLSVTMVGETSKNRGEYWLVNWLIAMTDGVREAMGMIHSGRGSEKRREHRDLRQAELYESRMTQRYNILVHCLHSAPELLEDASVIAKREAENEKLRLIRVKGAARQSKSMWSAVTGIPLL